MIAFHRSAHLTREQDKGVKRQLPPKAIYICTKSTGLRSVPIYFLSGGYPLIPHNGLTFYGSAVRNRSGDFEIPRSTGNVLSMPLFQEPIIFLAPKAI